MTRVGEFLLSSFVLFVTFHKSNEFIWSLFVWGLAVGDNLVTAFQSLFGREWALALQGRRKEIIVTAVESGVVSGQRRLVIVIRLLTVLATLLYPWHSTLLLSWEVVRLGWASTVQRFNASIRLVIYCSFACLWAQAVSSAASLVGDITGQWCCCDLWGESCLLGVCAMALGFELS